MRRDDDETITARAPILDDEDDGEVCTIRGAPLDDEDDDEVCTIRAKPMDRGESAKTGAHAELKLAERPRTVSVSAALVPAPTTGAATRVTRMPRRRDEVYADDPLWWPQWR